MKKHEKKQKISNAGKPDAGSPLFFIISLLLLASAAILRYFCPEELYILGTQSYASQYFSNAYPYLMEMIVHLFKKVFAVYARGYLLPSYVFLAPSIILMAFGYARWKGLKTDFFSFVENEKNEKKLKWGLFFTSLISCLLVQFILFWNYPTISDEFSYVFEGDLIASGKLYAESPPMPEFFQSDNIINDGRWFSKYTIGWPFLLAIGRILHVQFMLAPLCVAFSVLIVYLMGKRLFGIKCGTIAAFLGIFSPFLFINGGTFFPHTSAALFTILAFYLIMLAFEENNLLYAALAGASLGFLVNIRPGDGAVVFIASLPMMLYYLIKSQNKKSAALKAFIVCLIFTCGIGVIMLVNYIQMGNPFLMGFIKFKHYEKWGFGNFGHSPVKGLWNVTYSFMRNQLWVVPFIPLLSTFSLFLKDMRVKLLLFIPLGFAAFYVGYFGLGVMEVGARFYVPAFVGTLVPASAGLLFLEEKWKKSGMDGVNLFIPSFFTCCAVFMIFGVYIRLFPFINDQIKEMRQMTNWTKNPPMVFGRSIIFIRDDPRGLAMSFNRNHWDYKNNKNLIVFFLTPAENKALLEKFPDRKPYMLTIDKEAGQYAVSKYFDNRETALNYYRAGLNYWHGMDQEFSRPRAEAAFKKSLELEPGNHDVMMDLAQLSFDMGKYQQAADLFSALTDDKKHKEEALYRLGRSLWELGKKDEAISTLERLIRDGKRENLVLLAASWAEYYRTHEPPVKK